jgi:heptosyltransferase-2
MAIQKEKYDILITSFEAQGWKLAFFAWLTGIPVRIGYRKNQPYDACFNILLSINDKEHEVERHWRILKALYIEHENIDVKFNVPFEEYSYLDVKFEKQKKIRICIHAGSSDSLSNKRWDLNNFIELSEKLYCFYDAQILFVGGENERKMADIIRANSKCPVTVLIGQLNLWETAYILKKSDILICNDSGLMHLAATLGTQVFAIFGPTDRIKNRPLENRHKVIYNDVPCSPCDMMEKCRHDEVCLNTITVDSVLQTVDAAMDKSPDE